MAFHLNVVWAFSNVMPVDAIAPGASPATRLVELLQRRCIGNAQLPRFGTFRILEPPQVFSCKFQKFLSIDEGFTLGAILFSARVVGKSAKSTLAVHFCRNGIVGTTRRQDSFELLVAQVVFLSVCLIA